MTLPGTSSGARLSRRFDRFFFFFFFALLTERARAEKFRKAPAPPCCSSSFVLRFLCRCPALARDRGASDDDPDDSDDPEDDVDNEEGSAPCLTTSNAAASFSTLSVGSMSASSKLRDKRAETAYVDRDHDSFAVFIFRCSGVSHKKKVPCKPVITMYEQSCAPQAHNVFPLRFFSFFLKYFFFLK